MPPITLTLAHSADADDVFMWWPITGKIDPKPGPDGTHAVVTPPVLDTSPLRFVAVPEDIQALNARAKKTGDLDITAISFHAFPAVASRYLLSACGWSMGEGFGPKLVTRAASGATAPSLAAWREAVRADRCVPRIAVPGMQTTAFLVLSLMLRHADGTPGFEPVPMRFDTILDAVAYGAVDAGLLIHEAQIDYERRGVSPLADLGAWWGESTGGLPLPLGANVVRRDLDTRFGPGTLARVGSLLRQSIEYALAHRDEGLAYARTFSPPIGDADLDRYVRMYVSPLTVDPRPRGLDAVRTLFSRGAAAGLCPVVGMIDLV